MSVSSLPKMLLKKNQWTQYPLRTGVVKMDDERKKKKNRPYYSSIYTLTPTTWA